MRFWNPFKTNWYNRIWSSSRSLVYYKKKTFPKLLFLCPGWHFETSIINTENHTCSVFVTHCLSKCLGSTFTIKMVKSCNYSFWYYNYQNFESVHLQLYFFCVFIQQISQSQKFEFKIYLFNIIENVQTKIQRDRLWCNV